MLSGSIDSSEDLGFDLVLRETLSPTARSHAIAEVAREQLAEAQAINLVALGVAAAFSTMVDGVMGRSEDDVRPNGSILYTFNLLPDIFAWILEQLQAFAPVRTGFFRSSFELFADGVKIDPNGEIPPAKEFVFMSSADYAAQLEGYPGRPPESSQAPNGVFEAVAALAQQRFGNQATIVFSYEYPMAGDLVNVLSARSARDRGIRKAANRTYVLTPAITITLGS